MYKKWSSLKLKPVIAILLINSYEIEKCFDWICLFKLCCRKWQRSYENAACDAIGVCSSGMNKKW